MRDAVIAFVPAGDENVASARIRVFSLQRSLRALGYEARIGLDPHATVLAVQKKVTHNVLQAAKAAKLRGALVLYDVDDLGDALWWWTPRPLFVDMLEIADLTIVATEAQRATLRNEFKAPSCEVLPGAIDYAPVRIEALANLNDRPVRVAWFGNNSNFDLFRAYATTLSTIDGVQPIAIVDSDAVMEHQGKFRAVEFHAWHRSTFVSLLRTCHMSWMSHQGNNDDQCKSNTKLVTSIAWGVPAAASRTPEYERTAHEAGISDALFEDEKGLVSIIEKLSTQGARRVYLEQAQPVIWRNYSPLSVARQFIDLLSGRVGQ